MQRIILRSIVAALLLVASFAASAGAHTIAIGHGHTKASEAASACAVVFTPKDYRWYASRVYRREKIRRPAFGRLRRMHICQASYRHRVKVGQAHRRYYRARRDRIRAARRAAQQARGGAGGILAAIRACESGGNYGADTGNGFYGAYQFTVGTWQAYGGSGMPHLNSPGEQDRIAARLLAAVGVHTTASWPNCP